MYEEFDPLRYRYFVRIECRIGQRIEFLFTVIALVHLDSEFIESVFVKMMAMAKRALCNCQAVYHPDLITCLNWMFGIVPCVSCTDDHRS